MNSYIITEKTIALKKLANKTIIYDVEKVKVINKNIKKILEDNCNFYGSSLNGRIKCVQKLLKIKYKVPIIVSESKNYILLQLNSLRDNECLFIMINKIVDYLEKDKNIQIVCVNNLVFDSKISKYSFEKMLLNSFKLNNILKWRKIVNYL